MATNTLKEFRAREEERWAAERQEKRNQLSERFGQLVVELAGMQAKARTKAARDELGTKLSIADAIHFSLRDTDGISVDRALYRCVDLNANRYAGMGYNDIYASVNEEERAFNASCRKRPNVRRSAFI